MEAYQDPGKSLGHVYHCGDGFSYHINRRKEHTHGYTTVFLRCDMATTPTACRGRASVLLTPEGSVWTDGNNEHCHPPDQFKHQLRLLRYELLEACRTEPYRLPRQMINLHSARYPVQVAARIRNNNIRSALMRARRAQYPNRPPSLGALSRLLEDPLNANLTATLDNTESIYEATVGPPGERCVILISNRMKKIMSKVKEVFVDATFVPTPQYPKGSQIYQIVCLEGSHVVPLMQVIMEKKSYIAYRSILHYIRQCMPRFRPRIAHMDFEYQQQKAWREVFPECVVRGCYFHYLKAMLKKVRKLGLTALCRQNIHVRRLIRCFTAIPLLPHHLIQRGVMTLIKVAIRLGIHEELFDFFAYYITTWAMGFRFETLSVYNEMHRTNNACEAANRILRLETGPYHPNVWDFLNAIKRYEQSAYTDHFALTEIGNDICRRRKTATLENDRAINNFTANLLTGRLSIKSFLRRASTRSLTVFNAAV